MKWARSHSGMTLLEVLIGVFLLMIIMSSLGQATWLTTRGKRRVDDRDLIFHQARVAMQRMVQDISMAILVEPVLTTLGRDVSAFKTGFIGRDGGKEDTLHLTTLSGRRFVVGVPAADQREIGLVARTK